MLQKIICSQNWSCLSSCELFLFASGRYYIRPRVRAVWDSWRHSVADSLSCCTNILRFFFRYNKSSITIRTEGIWFFDTFFWLKLSIWDWLIIRETICGSFVINCFVEQKFFERFNFQKAFQMKKALVGTFP